MESARGGRVVQAGGECARRAVIGLAGRGLAAAAARAALAAGKCSALSVLGWQSLIHSSCMHTKAHARRTPSLAGPVLGLDLPGVARLALRREHAHKGGVGVLGV